MIEKRDLVRHKPSGAIGRVTMLSGALDGEMCLVYLEGSQLPEIYPFEEIELVEKAPIDDGTDYGKQLSLCDSQERAKKLLHFLEKTDDIEKVKDMLLTWFNSCDAIGEHSAGLRKQFERCGFITDEENKLPEFPVTVYRAVWEGDDPSQGLSWTTDLDFAIRFAKGFFTPRARYVLNMYRENCQAQIWSATCSSAHAYITSRKEFEVIPKDLEDVELLYTLGEKK